MDDPQQPGRRGLTRRGFALRTGTVLGAAIATTLLAACGGGATVAPTPVPTVAQVATPGASSATQPAPPQGATATASATAAGSTTPVPAPTSTMSAMPAMSTTPSATAARASATIMPTSATPSAATTRPGAGIVAVQIVDFAFVPADLTVAVGTTVAWTNTGVEHTTTSSDDVWGSEVLARGDTFRYTFTRPGTYPYICGLHPDMQATIIAR